MKERTSRKIQEESPPIHNRKSTSNVLLFVETSREFGRGLLYGIAKYSRLHGHWRIHRRPLALDSSLPDWREMKIDGAIARDVKVAQALIHSGFPVIFVQHSRDMYKNFPVIITDSPTIGQMAAEHFLDRGFRNFAYCGFDDFAWSKGRNHYFRQRVKQDNLKVNTYQQPKSKAKRLWENERYLIVDWLMSLPKPVALFCCNDDRALQVVEACELAGVHVPEDVAVLGVDNDALVCDLAEPPISSIAMGTEAAGYEAAEVLDQMMKGKKATGKKIIVYPTHITIRVSTDIAAVSDTEVATAIRFIRKNTDRAIQVRDVINATAVSRRVLENRFRTALRRSIHQEIRRMRVDRIIQLLIGTNMSIKEIALRCGFDGVEHIARYFRKVTGFSLREYRRKRKPN
jgi:LacI family transcriptional regulator